MIRFIIQNGNLTLSCIVTTFLAALISCSFALANSEQDSQTLHNALQPLLESNALTYIPGSDFDPGIIAVTENVRYQNEDGNIHINKHPLRLSALESLIITNDLVVAMKPDANVMPMINVLIQAGLTARTEESELITIIHDENSLHAQVTSAKNPEACLTEAGCEADEITLE